MDPDQPMPMIKHTFANECGLSVQAFHFSISPFLHFFLVLRYNYIYCVLFLQLYPYLDALFLIAILKFVFLGGRVDYQSRPSVSGVASFKQLLARLPPRVYSVYYRDDIGNISSSHLRLDSKKVIIQFIFVINK